MDAICGDVAQWEALEWGNGEWHVQIVSGGVLGLDHTLKRAIFKPEFPDIDDKNLFFLHCFYGCSDACCVVGCRRYMKTHAAAPTIPPHLSELGFQTLVWCWQS